MNEGRTKKADRTPRTVVARRQLPAVHAVLDALGETGLPAPMVTALVRREIATARAAATGEDLAGVGDGLTGTTEQILAQVRHAADALLGQRLRPVINATGVLIHTNLGRAPLGARQLAAMAAVAAYSNLELDLSAGQRGSRGAFVEQELAVLCGTDAALVVNNCAAALVLAVSGLVTAARGEVVISRGELVQIGGGFRLPEILAASGAALKEIGTTNKTSIADYARAIGPRTALVLRVLRSNFVQRGFVETPSSAEIAAVCRNKRVVFMEDTGSGGTEAARQCAANSPEAVDVPLLSPRRRPAADLICFSGDKLLGGPQAGVLAGKKRLVLALRQRPLFRALRPDKFTLAALEVTVEAHLGHSAADTLPLMHLAEIPVDALKIRAAAIVAAVAKLPLRIDVRDSLAEVGGGALSGTSINSAALVVHSPDISPRELARRLRVGKNAVMVTVREGRTWLDMRTIFPAQDDLIVQALNAACLTPAADDGGKMPLEKVAGGH